MRGFIPFWILLWLNCPCAWAQRSTPFSLGTPEGYVEGASTPKQVKHVYPEREYHWLRGGGLHTTQGGRAGKLLHGRYSACDEKGQLRESGVYKLGLKDGEWRTWNADGRLQLLQRWKAGRREGRSLVFDKAGQPMRMERYRHDVLTKVKMLNKDTLKAKEKEGHESRVAKKRPEPAADRSEDKKATHAGKVRSKEHSRKKRKQVKADGDEAEKHGGTNSGGPVEGGEH